ncbi:MAG: hypothetical protein N3A38_06435 [Planctomycetota bacterium]|nr:hypothetical protein [Planctomycetota bacterium]
MRFGMLRIAEAGCLAVAAAIFATGCGGDAKGPAKGPQKGGDAKPAGGPGGSSVSANPYSRAKVGDWVEHVTETESGGKKMYSKTRREVKAADEKSVTIATTVEAEGMKMPPSEQKIDLAAYYRPEAGQGTVKPEIKEGEEEIEVGGRKYRCRWVEMKVAPAGIETISKTWMCPDVPLDGIVRQETTARHGNDVTKAVMTLTGCGRGQ